MNLLSPSSLFKTIGIPSLIFLGACCHERPIVEAPPPPPPAPVAVVVPGLGDVFFDFDKSALRADAVEQLKTNANWIQADGARRVVIEGHCDERGTNEYNLALGERRANSAKDYIVNLGVEAARLKTVSYGEEKPFAMGHDEDAWAQNRRAHFVPE
jgi:peptidoglycan-associated lipoprotein